MSNESEAPGGQSSSGENRRLYVELWIRPAPGCPCPLGGFDSNIQEIRQNFVDGECLTDTTFTNRESTGSSDENRTDIVHTTSDIEVSCPCRVFGEFDCVPKLIDVEDGRIRIETYLPDRDCLSDLVDALRSTAAGLQLHRLKRVDTSETGADPHALDLYELTEKQREAAARAVSAGYYETPRETTLAELAQEFGISKSALSQRLSAVESKLATSTFAGESTDGQVS